MCRLLVLVSFALACCVAQEAVAAAPQLKPGLWKFTALSLDSPEQDELICMTPQVAARIGADGWGLLEDRHAHGCTITRRGTSTGYDFDYQCPGSDPRGSGSYSIEVANETRLHTIHKQAVTLSLNAGATHVPMESETTGEAEWIGSDCGAIKQ
jgi:hypothetical protein